MDRRSLVAVLLLVVGGVLVAGTVLDGPDGHTNAGYLDVRPVDADAVDGPVVAFEDLTPDQQHVFERALADEDGSVSIPDGVKRDVWIDNRAVTYRNRTYSVAVAVS